MSMDDVIFYFAMLHDGDWDKIYESIYKRETMDLDKLEEYRKQNKYPYITIVSPLYPDGFKHISHPPYILFYEGDIELLKSMDFIAVIGSRDMTSYGEKMIEKIVPDLVSEGYGIVSGLAKGADRKAHEVTLKSYGKTVAAIANGLDVSYPKENAELYEKIRKDGLIISEYPQGVKPEKAFFARRNRLIAGLSKGILVAEAYDKSGTLITVRLGLEAGKDIFCVPARADEGSVCNKLIKQGAKLVEGAGDILEEYSF